MNSFFLHENKASPSSRTQDGKIIPVVTINLASIPSANAETKNNTDEVHYISPQCDNKIMAVKFETLLFDQELIENTGASALVNLLKQAKQMIF